MVDAVVLALLVGGLGALLGFVATVGQSASSRRVQPSTVVILTFLAAGAVVALFVPGALRREADFPRTLLMTLLAGAALVAVVRALPSGAQHSLGTFGAAVAIVLGAGGLGVVLAAGATAVDPAILTVLLFLLPVVLRLMPRRHPRSLGTAAERGGPQEDRPRTAGGP